MPPSRHSPLLLPASRAYLPGWVFSSGTYRSGTYRGGRRKPLTLRLTCCIVNAPSNKFSTCSCSTARHRRWMQPRRWRCSGSESLAPRPGLAEHCAHCMPFSWQRRNITSQRCFIYGIRVLVGALYDMFYEVLCYTGPHGSRAPPCRAPSRPEKHPTA